jgi:sarcosine oxidase subunit alpha
MSPGPAEVLERDEPVEFSFDGRTIVAFAGDTVGSALAASGVVVLSRSFKYHRPRGLLCCSGRCPNCLLDVDGTPNVRACTTVIESGMTVRSQNAWPSLGFDLLSISDRLDRLMPVGFYYKTFIRPRRLWPLYERVLRRAAGLGRVDVSALPDLHPRKRHLHCDVAVVGGGPVGCIAALEAAGAGARVVLVDDQDRLGGHLRFRSRAVTGDDRVSAPSGFVASQRLAELVGAEPLIEHLAGATAIGTYEGGLLGVAQGDTFVRLRHAQLVIATGAAERPMLFDGNDRPGVMLASGILRLRHFQGVAAGEAIVVVTDDDHGWRSAAELVAAGLGVRALVDVRPRAVVGTSGSSGQVGRSGMSSSQDPKRPEEEVLASAGVEILVGTTVLGVKGRGSVKGLSVSTPDGERTLECDIVAVAARREPLVELFAQAGSPPRYDESIGEFVPDALPEDIHAAGDVLDPTSDQSDLQSAIEAGRAAAAAARKPATDVPASQTGAAADPRAAAGTPVPADVAETSSPTHVAAEPMAMPDRGRKRFVCLCEDVTVKDIERSVAEGFEDLETLKRYSTILMGPCQGKMCAGLATRTHARLAGTSPAASGLTTSRPPVRPVSLAALAGPHLDPVRRTALHERHESLAARWTDMGAWKRPLDYGSVEDECRAVREAAGIIDVSTLGKLDIQGPDAGPYLDWLHPNRFSDMKIGRVRYRAMLDDAGTILDDGTVARLGDERFFVSTTTGNIDSVDQWLRWWLAYSERDVSVTDVTSQFAAINLAGPRSREILSRVADVDVSRDAMPYLAAVEGVVAGIPAVILRIGFVGELGYEIHVPADFALHLWDALVAAGEDHGLRPFGVEAQRVLRLEKQHAIIGQDTDALSNAVEAGMGWLVKADKPDFIGHDAVASLAAAKRQGATQRQILTGFEVEGATVPAEGAAIVRGGRAIGRVTSAKWSPTLTRTIGLAWLSGDAATDGAPISVRLGVGTSGETVEGRVRRRPFYDPEGKRLRM